MKSKKSKSKRSRSTTVTKEQCVGYLVHHMREAKRRGEKVRLYLPTDSGWVRVV